METGIYIHIPFCESKCYYCDYASYVNLDSKYKMYIDAIIKEIELYKNLINEKYKVKTVFIGGGTPSVLPSILLEKLLYSISNNFNFSNNIEFTMESNPGTLSKEKLKIMKKYKVNRISLGVQAFQGSLLKSIGRNHKVEDIISSYNMCKEVGFNNINIDLMYGIPGQTIDQWKDTLSKAISLGPDHISAYSLIVEDGTKFGDMYSKGQLETVDEDLEIKMYSYAKNILKEYGYYQYELSNFASLGKESTHLIDGWRLKEYIGIGLGSHSHFQNYRFNNTYNMKQYLLNTSNLNLVQENKVYIDIKAKMEEYMFLGLMLTKGINIYDFKEKFKKSIFEVYEKSINTNIKNKLLIQEGDNIFLSDLGHDLSNIVFSSFLID